MIRRVAAATLLVGGVLSLYVALTVFEVWRVGRESNTATAEAIVVMGAAQYDGSPSPQLAARLDHAYALWKAGVAPKILVTGGNQPGDRFTEAEASRGYLIERGVRADAIFEEATSRSTWEAVANIRRLNDDEKFGERLHSIVIVTDPFHSLRSRLIAEENGFDATTSATTTSPVDGTTAMSKHLKEGAGVAIGR
ncbi:MAG: YdcF family protein, partial [Ilumatobacteraceae bacterium]|nr:YdcF family protein [Ilumatobacteraceae bacterium]